MLIIITHSIKSHLKYKELIQNVFYIKNFHVIQTNKILAKQNYGRTSTLPASSVFIYIILSYFLLKAILAAYRFPVSKMSLHSLIGLFCQSKT